jgi:hypothetical protein
MTGLQFPPHLPAHPQQKNAAREKQPDDLEKLRREAGKYDPQHRCGDDPDQDGPVALLRRQTGGGEADDHGVVARQHQVIMITWRKAERASALRSSLILGASHGCAGLDQDTNWHFEAAVRVSMFRPRLR